MRTESAILNLEHLKLVLYHLATKDPLKRHCSHTQGALQTMLTMLTPRIDRLKEEHNAEVKAAFDALLHRSHGGAKAAVPGTGKNAEGSGLRRVVGVDFRAGNNGTDGQTEGVYVAVSHEAKLRYKGSAEGPEAYVGGAV